MKLKISVSERNREALETFLSQHGIETGDGGEFTVTEASRYPGFLPARDGGREHIRIAADDVIFIESFGKDIEIHTLSGTCYSPDRMYTLESLLDPQEFLRVSKSVIIARKHVKKNRPSLSMKFILTMSDGTLVDVTRSYYSAFRAFFGILKEQGYVVISVFLDHSRCRRRACRPDFRRRLQKAARQGDERRAS